MGRRRWVARDARGPGAARLTPEEAVELLLTEGPQRLSDEALLEAVFGDDGAASARTAGALEEAGGLKALCAREPSELVSFSGLDPRRSAQLAAAVELGRRVMSTGDRRPVLKTPEEIFKQLAPQLCGLRREVFHVLCLNSRNVMLANVRVAQGGVNACPVDPREVFHAAIRHKAAAVVLVHNHPSGDPSPSDSDLQLTHQLLQGARLLCLRVLDHLVLGDWTWSSMAQSGHLHRLGGGWEDGAWLGGR
jgi:DNA repair protein RadC